MQLLETVVVAPLVPEKKVVTITKLNPKVGIEGKDFHVSIQDLAGVPRNRLGAVVANVSGQHADFVAAIDLLFTGI